jgi:hypothetical protein
VKPLFVAISGKKGSGKDELARLINARLDSRFGSVITHFADPLKEICIRLFGLDSKLVYGSNTDKQSFTNVLWDGLPLKVRVKYATQGVKFHEEEDREIPVPRIGPMTIRELLQVMGTDIFRERVYNNIWAEYPFKQNWDSMEQGEVREPTHVVFIADCRFPNEVAETLKNGGIVIRVVRNTGHIDNHPSETALDNYDWNQPSHFLIDNNGSLDELRNESTRLAAIIGGRVNAT